jgi:hypothetical protein
MATTVVEVVIAVIVPLSKATTVAMVAVAMVAIAIERLGIATTNITFRA